MPALVFAPAPCPRCRARTEAEAATMCRPERDMTGEGTCPTVDNPVIDGKLTDATPASIAAIDAWIDRQMKGRP